VTRPNKVEQFVSSDDTIRSDRTRHAAILPVPWPRAQHRERLHAVSEREIGSDGLIAISEHNRVLLAIHKAMRADGRRLREAVEHLQEGDAERAAAVGRAFGVIASLIHDHHWTEDDVMYPFLIEHVASFEADVIQLENDHIDLDAAMARLGARFRLLAHGLSPLLWRDTHEHLEEEAAAFHQVLITHLDREEAVVVPAVDGISEAEQRDLHKRESKLETYRHIRMAVPWVLANATPAEAAELRAGAPRVLNIVEDHVWARHFAKVMAPLYNE
jgi:hemerythrin-like domain-containing protein